MVLPPTTTTTNNNNNSLKHHPLNSITHSKNKNNNNNLLPSTSSSASSQPSSSSASSSASSSSSPANNRYSNSDVTRPTLKRLTAEQEATINNNNNNSNNNKNITSNQIWFTKQLHSSPKGKQPNRSSPSPENASTPLAHNPNRIKGDRDVLIHQVEKNHTLAGIALSYGISLPALRKANGMWPTDPLTIKPTLRIPLGLCNLPPSKKIEIEQDSGKVLVWEQDPHHPRSTHSSSSPSNSSLTINPSTEHLLLSSSAHHHHHHHHHLRHPASQSNLLDCSSSSDASDHLHQKHLSTSSSTSSYAHQTLPYAQLGELAPISNSGSPPPSPQPTVASLEKVPAHQLGFFTTSNHPHHLHPQTPTNHNQLSPSKHNQTHRTVSDSLPIPTRTSTGLVSPSSSNLRQRSTTNQSSSNIPPTTPSSKKPTLPIAIPSSSSSPSDDPRKSLFNPADQPQISPDSQKKLVSQIHLFSHSRIPRVSSHHQDSHPSGDDYNTEDPNGRALKTIHSGSSSRWTTVRPGRPPPLNRQLKFLEESTTERTNKFASVVSNAIDGLFSRTPSSLNHSKNPIEPSLREPRPSSSTLSRNPQPKPQSQAPMNPLIAAPSDAQVNPDELDSFPGCDGSIWNVWNQLFVPSSSSSSSDHLAPNTPPTDPSFHQ
ncbi:hypothetical protein PGTUg99_005592 [Puccinia graminis f. sp. tritici]|uniref:LysM domain-containing protein n=1 Tax=Puccinia graminis f. sp. tritici TaxID=56615 RepID=A0A5B0NT15_PUCGR|nr:hypothetical protein PGTUg99_005592 [Puccinia graminis f. sp. tritici]